MKQPWIHKPLTDSVFILGPAFIVTAIAFLFHRELDAIEESYPFYVWLFLIVFVDVAHVYATLFKTYLVPSRFRERKRLLVVLPIVSFLVGLVLFSFGSAVFWSVLAYVAVFHFIRQQYGFMRLYSRQEPKTRLSVFLDSVFIYSAAGYPMLFWFCSSERRFNWFTEHEFFRFESAALLSVLGWIYAGIVVLYGFRTVYEAVVARYVNLPKHAIIIGTGISWYTGIVYFDNDLIFTLLNVVSHGIPYIALVYLREIDAKPREMLGGLASLKYLPGLVLYVAILLMLAFTEEYVWDVMVWNDHFEVAEVDFSSWSVLLVPLLTVPQLTHYLLDGFIWKSR
ncbi:MAG TPA: hypothetical protein VK183_11410 [Flavobacterium sp.]|nr:hypothetical protein [Flavobacterium sp.]